MSLNLKKVVGCLSIIEVLTLEDSDVCRITLLFLAKVVIAEIPSCFSVL